jgi:pyridoxal phosphate enzyme (YggS family)
VSDPLDPALLAEAAARVAEVRARIARAAARAGRDPAEIRLVGACKHQPIERIAAAVCAGVGELGENYVQEARAKRPRLESLLAAHFEGRPAPQPRWRLIGHLQRNKARHAVGCFDAIDSLDREDLALELERRAAAAELRLEVCIQVNVSGEASKSGAAEASVEALLRTCAPLAHLQVVGLMAVPAAEEDPERSRPAFAHLRRLRDKLSRAPGGESLRELSMGMSADMEPAIEEGATLVRVGTALFGPRPAAPMNV